MSDCGCTPSDNCEKVDVKVTDMEDFRTRVLGVIEEIRPGLQMDGGDIKLVDLTESGQVQVTLQGACSTCPHATMTLKMGVESVLKDKVPEVTEVVAID